MPATLFEIAFVVAWIVAEVIRFPHRQRNKRERRLGRMVATPSQGLEIVVSLLAFLGMQVLPLVYIFAPWFDSRGYYMPASAGWIGMALMAAALWLLWRAHADLGRNWPPTLEISPDQRLVTHGVYGVIRHPIYAALWLWCIAQALLLPNWIGGLAGLVTLLPVHVLRVPREERMMREHFGEAYHKYSERTGGAIPRLRR
ncbi:MAG: protein-S-isoprenylcysteine O-methyltransferase [Anaerolineae bacterium]